MKFLLLVIALSSPAVFAADADVIEANRLEYRLADLESRASEMAVTQVTLRQQVLDAGPELSRKVCDQIALKLSASQDFEYLVSRTRELEKRKNAKKLSAAQIERLARVKRRIASLREDSSMDCKALAPLNP